MSVLSSPTLDKPEVNHRLRTGPECGKRQRQAHIRAKVRPHHSRRHQSGAESIPGALPSHTQAARVHARAPRGFCESWIAPIVRTLSCTTTECLISTSQAVCARAAMTRLLSMPDFAGLSVSKPVTLEEDSSPPPHEQVRLKAPSLTIALTCVTENREHGMGHTDRRHLQKAQGQF